MMAELPKPVWQYIQGWLESRFVFGYILTDADGRVLGWGGALQRLGIPRLEKERLISDQLLFTEGLLPTQVPSLYLPMVKIDSTRSLDVHLFRTEQGHGLFLVDVTKHEYAIAQWQQKANELALMQARRVQAAAQTADSAGELCHALDIAAMKCNADGTFVLLGPAPRWLERFFQDAVPGRSLRLTPESTFSFLENFLDDAQAFWRQDRVGCIRSGLWIESAGSGKEHFYEAIAVTTAHDRMLLIARNLSYFDEKQDTIQKGRDIAVQKGVLEQLRKDLMAARNDLEQQVRKRTGQLQEANARLADELAWRQHLEQERTEILRQLQQSQKMEAIGTLAGGIAHDFNNILSAILGFTELSLGEARANSALRSNLKQVMQAAERARDLIRQILTFSRQSKPEPKPIQLKSVVQEALKLLRASLPAIIEIEDEVKSHAMVMADLTQMHQVIMNLCTNAAQAMPPEGGTLTVRLHDLVIQPAQMADYPDLQSGAHIELTVKDSGHGMSDEVIRRIYDPFFTTKEKGKGTGMGLSVVHGIVKSCRGAIYVSSQPGVGTIFRVLLPVVTAADWCEPKTALDMPCGNERILFIDDEPVQTELASQMLGRLGYQVMAITDSLEALERFAKEPDQFDLVISDMNMPKINGRALAIKLHQIRPDVPIILCSGSADALEKTQPADMHIQRYLTKPVAMREMARTIRQALDR
jgi:signal transduction histidine kinase